MYSDDIDCSSAVHQHMGMRWDALISLGLARSKSGRQLVKITSSDIETRHLHCSCADQAMSHSEGARALHRQ